MKINQHTKISSLIKENPNVIDAIASINKHFEKLRNPILRKILASRVTIEDAAKIGGTNVQAFYDKLKPLGFFCDSETTPISITQNSIPAFYQILNLKEVEELDVRNDLASGIDPFNKITAALAQMPKEHTLKLINSFEPLPLINLLKKKGYSHYTVLKEPSLVYTYLKYTGAKTENKTETKENKISNKADFETVLKSFGERIKTIDVRTLEMPLPFITILTELETLAPNTLLFVHHKKFPQFLIPELQNRGFQWQINEDDEGEVKIIIYQ